MIATARAGPPMVDWTRNSCRAQFDYIKVWHPKRALLPALSGTKRWVPEKHGHARFSLTVQDPTKQDIRKLIDALGDPQLKALQLAVDIQPKAGIAAADRSTLLQETFDAVAGRFRPEDEALWGYGTRGGVQGPGQIPKPFHRRFPAPEEQLIYGRRNGWMQATMYLKRVNEKKSLNPKAHRVRMELALERGGITEIGLHVLSDLLGYPYRLTFTKHFRIVSEPRVRAIETRSVADLVKKLSVNNFDHQFDLTDRDDRGGNVVERDETAFELFVADQ